MKQRKRVKSARKLYPDGDGIESIPIRRAGVYQVLNTVTGAGYIGSAVDVRVRCQMHRSQLHQGDHHNRRVQRDAKIYGPGAFRFKVVEFVEELRELASKEAQWIRWLQSQGPGASYNLEIGVKMLPESRYLIAERVLLEHRNFCLLPGVSRGDPVSEEFLSTWTPNSRLRRRG